MKASINHRGASMVEAAIVLPVIVLILTLFWDVMAGIVVKQRQLSSLIQLSINSQPKPLSIAIVSSGTVASGTALASTVSRLSETITPPATQSPLDQYLQVVGSNLMDFMNNSGSFSSATPSSVALKLVYIQVNPTNGQVTTTPTGEWYYPPSPSTTSPVVVDSNPGTPCINPANLGSITTQLNTYMMQRINLLNPAGAVPYIKEIGTLLYDVTIFGTPSKAFLTDKPVVFGVLCTRYSILGSRDGRLPFMFFPNKEVGT